MQASYCPHCSSKLAPPPLLTQNPPFTINTNSADPNFYNQFSVHSNPDVTKRQANVERLEKSPMRYYYIATLEIRPVECPELAELILKTMVNLLVAKGIGDESVFVHFIQSIKILRSEIIAHIRNNDDEEKFLPKVSFFQRLINEFVICNEFNLFVNLDLAGKDINQDLIFLNSVNFGSQFTQLNLSGSTLTRQQLENVDLPINLTNADVI